MLFITHRKQLTKFCCTYSEVQPKFSKYNHINIVKCNCKSSSFFFLPDSTIKYVILVELKKKKNKSNEICCTHISLFDAYTYLII